TGSLAVRVLSPVLLLTAWTLMLFRSLAVSTGHMTAPYGDALFVVLLIVIFEGILVGLGHRLNKLEAERDREHQAREELERYVTMCAWTRRVRHDGEWISVEEFLQRRFGLDVSHGIADDVLLEEIERLKEKA